MTLILTRVSVCHRSPNSSLMTPSLRQWKTANWKGIKASGASVVSYSFSSNSFPKSFSCLWEIIKSLRIMMFITSGVIDQSHLLSSTAERKNRVHCVIHDHHPHHCWTGLHRPEPHSPQRCKTCLNRRFSQLPVQRTQRAMVRSCSDNTNGSHQNHGGLGLHNARQMPSARVHTSDTPKVN